MPLFYKVIYWCTRIYYKVKIPLTQLKSRNGDSSIVKRKSTEIPDDIWLLIFQHVRRPTEEIMKDRSERQSTLVLAHNREQTKPIGDWGNYHQNDLNFHRLASPALYGKAIVNDPDLFFYGINTSSPSTNRLSKINQLAHVQSLTMIYASTLCPSRTINFDEVSIYRRPLQRTTKEFIKNFIIALDSTRNANFEIANYRSNQKVKTTKVFPNLQQVVMGISPFFSSDQHKWLFSDGATKRPVVLQHDLIVKDLLTQRREIGYEFAEMLNEISFLPLKMCNHSLHGPWGISLSPAKFILHHPQRQQS
ncbi:uncharacterized protein I206_103590 [Kwoniella pini CBS 10737]|uniref:Uncharacterized protein n=1 Tax=Kwoniella pini CBS 10737 TaxID=1296096 RepID=A0A1B9I940_9TREE|nr:uncharacterized protein I206_01407 [Kwoniella pini CBS 10737]OCF52122.1 hypothetical protein I206_01407 [Kwoniella pini CBS 10737]